MRIRMHIAGVAVGLVVAALAAATPAAAARPIDMTQREYQAMVQAMVVRGQALNVMYGLGKPSGMTDAQYRAELIRGTALNERYGVPVALSADGVAALYGKLAPTEPQAPAAAPVTAPTGNGFDWTDALIGAGIAAALLLLGAAGALSLRHQHLHLPHH